MSQAPSTLQIDLAVLQTITATVKDLELFFHELVDEICGKTVDLSKYKEVPNISKVTRNFKILVKHVVGKSITKKEQISEIVRSLGLQDDKIIELVFEVVSTRFDDVRKTLVNEASQLGQAYLKDFDWKLQLTISSDKMSTLREPHLLLNLNIHDNNEGQEKSALVEFTKDDLQKLIDTLEAVNQVCVTLKS